MRHKWNPLAPMAPFDQAGNMQSYEMYNSEMLPAPDFYAELMLIRASRGRSSALFIWEDTSSKKQYPMFISDLQYLLKSGQVVFGVVPYSKWQVVKRGQNYGIALCGA